jgi:lantibiotic modifying enzyme
MSQDQKTTNKQSRSTPRQLARELRPEELDAIASISFAGGLSRLCALRYWNDPQLLDEIEAAMATTAASFAGNPTLRHGDLGNADILLNASEIVTVPRWRGYAAQVAAIAIGSARESGWKCSNALGVESLGPMTGLAGIGYPLLHQAAPTHVASVLALEPPVLS